MADAVTSVVMRNAQMQKQGGGFYTVHLTNVSDGTGEAAVQKVDVSALVSGDNETATRLVIQNVIWGIQGFTYVTLLWDRAGTDDVAALLPGGFGALPFHLFGGLPDENNGDGTGDLLLTAPSGSSGATYNILLDVAAYS